MARTEKTVITNHDILNDFIYQRDVGNPQSYIRHIVHDQVRVVPVFYYIHQAEISIADTIKLLLREPTPRKTHRKKLIDRISRRSDCHIRPGPSTLPYRQKILDGEGIDFSRVENRVHAVRAIRTIEADEIDFESCLSVLRAAIHDYEREQDNDFLGEIRYAAAHVDTAVYGKKIAAE